MRITVLTLFPEYFDSFKLSPVVRRAVEKGICELDIVDIRTFAPGSFRHLDDSPFGGGPGMVMRCQPVLDALASLKSENTHTVLLSPKGSVYSQKKAHELANRQDILLICGHYEGVDARVENHVDEQLSIGDYVLTGGEVAATVVIDSVVRLLKGALRDTATTEESHENGLLEYPQYTQPADFRGEKVPPVLLSGNDKAIRDWRLTQSLLLTRKNRPDLFRKYALSEYEKELLKLADADKVEH